MQAQAQLFGHDGVIVDADGVLRLHRHNADVGLVIELAHVEKVDHVLPLVQTEHGYDRAHRQVYAVKAKHRLRVLPRRLPHGVCHSGGRVIPDASFVRPLPHVEKMLPAKESALSRDEMRQG